MSHLEGNGIGGNDPNTIVVVCVATRVLQIEFNPPLLRQLHDELLEDEAFTDGMTYDTMVLAVLGIVDAVHLFRALAFRQLDHLLFQQVV